MSKPTQTSWFSYLKWGLIKFTRKKILGPICRWLLKSKPVWPVIVNFKKEVKKYSHFDKAYQDYPKYLTIYNTVRRFKPKYVLECGSGISTAIINQALKENGSGKLVSLDEMEKFGQAVAQIVGPEVAMVISPVEETAYQNIAGTRYLNAPDYPYDLVFVDGPVTATVDLDAFYVLEKYPRARVLIDCRTKTIRALKTKYAGNYNPFTNMGKVNFAEK